MATINFFRQLRRDGGIRTGIDVDGNTVLSQFIAGNEEEPDPSIDWYVDVRCEGSRLPSAPEPVRQWLLRHEPAIRHALEALARAVPAGIDPGSWPIKHPFRLGMVRGAIVCSAIRRVSAQNVADVLNDIALNWSKYVTGLLTLQYH